MRRGAGVTDNFGFLPSAYANINLIRDNLHDRYRDVYTVDVIEELRRLQGARNPLDRRVLDAYPQLTALLRRDADIPRRLESAHAR